MRAALYIVLGLAALVLIWWAFERSKLAAVPAYVPASGAGLGSGGASNIFTQIVAAIASVKAIISGPPPVALTSGAAPRSYESV